MNNCTEFIIVELFHLLWTDCVIVDNDSYCIGAYLQLFVVAIIWESSQVLTVPVKPLNANNGRKTVEKNPRKGKVDKTSKPKPKAKTTAIASITNLKAPPKASVGNDDDSHQPKPCIFVSPSWSAKTKAIENMYHAATGRHLPLSESDVSEDDGGSEGEEPVYQSKKGTNQLD